MAPSYYLLSIGYVSVFERILSYVVDAVILGAIIYLILVAVRWFLAHMLE
jgi:hypothetical protein